MTIQTIIKKAIKRLELENKLLTPEFYSEAFCKEAAKAGMSVEDCSQVDKFVASLNTPFQKELTQYRIKTTAELVRYLISKLNRTDSSLCNDTLEAQTIFTKRVLQVVGVLHNKDASDLAKRSIELLNAHPSLAQLEQYKQLWINFITTYDDSFLQKLGSFSAVDTSDLRKTIEQINTASAKEKSGCVNPEYTKIASLLVASFVPSIASKANEKIASLSKKIGQNPALLEDTSIENEIKTAISLRIALDKKSVAEMIKALDSVLDKLSHRLIDMIERSDNSTGEIQKIKEELNTYEIGAISDFKLAHKKLFTIAVALEENTKALSKDLKQHSDDVKIMGEKIAELEEELRKTKEELKEDFLTKLYNKRALDEFMTQKEAAYERYGHNYSVVMFDLDYFKQVNDNYGHEAGDAVLTAFAKILKKECRSVDIVGRYGGEEFMAILSETDTAGGVTFAEKVRAHVQKARFMYKGERINVTVSCGVSERAKHLSMKNVINSADEYLYTAKKNGRNRVAH
jgi:diguanylate cyclase